jgi:hypothetical protein
VIFQHGQTIIRIRRTSTGTDDYGNEEFTTDEVAVHGVGVAPRSSSEREQGETTVIVGKALYVPPGVSILASDQFRIGGVVYQVEGEPGEWTSPFTGTQFGTEVAIRRVY